MMEKRAIDQVIDFLAASGLGTLDLTGGAPELNPYFRDLIQTAWEMGIHVIDRCNLTVLEEPGQEGLVGFLAVLLAGADAGSSSFAIVAE
jgi:MoaA/NifB/PqqE/SkfB family radical SAM enzyme